MVVVREADLSFRGESLRARKGFVGCTIGEERNVPGGHLVTPMVLATR